MAAPRTTPLAAVFAYGTLEVPEIMRSVTGRDFPYVAATLSGWSRTLLRGRCYPGVRRAPGATTSGVLYVGVDAATLARLDAYEGDEYVRKRVRVSTTDGVREAWAWVVPSRLAHRLGRRPWDRAAFVQEHGTAWGLGD